MSGHGMVEAIYVAKSNGGPAHRVGSAAAVAGKGLVGDRHFDDPDAGDITLIEVEAIEAARTGHGVALKPGESRRQVHVRGVDLGDLIGRRFRVGEIECYGEERCEPCSHLAGLVGTQDVLKGLLHTGLRSRILKGGTIQDGDVVSLVSSAALVEG